MGAWGTGVFEDDTALDFMDEELLPSKDPRGVMRSAFEAALSGEYLSYEAGQAVLVSAAAIRALRAGEPLSGAEDESWAQWRAAHAGTDFSDIGELAARACRAVASENSELNGLWQENRKLYPQWTGGIEALAAAVGTLSPRQMLPPN